MVFWEFESEFVSSINIHSFCFLKKRGVLLLILNLKLWMEFIINCGWYRELNIWVLLLLDLSIKKECLCEILRFISYYLIVLQLCDRLETCYLIASFLLLIFK